MSEFLESLTNVRGKVWGLWSKAAIDRSGPANLAVLATARRGQGASSRLLVLRTANKASETLTFWTNGQSEKVKEIEACPNVELLFWIPEIQCQIRADALMSVRDGDPKIWKSLNRAARQNYAVAPAPNYAVAPAPSVTLTTPEAAFAEVDVAQFKELRARVVSIDVLSLASTPHRRAMIDSRGARWIAP